MVPEFHILCVTEEIVAHFICFYRGMGPISQDLTRCLNLLCLDWVPLTTYILLGMQARVFMLKAPDFASKSLDVTVHINLHRNQWHASIRTGVDGPSDVDECKGLRINKSVHRYLT
jgi:hypothetical protein